MSATVPFAGLATALAVTAWGVCCTPPPSLRQMSPTSKGKPTQRTLRRASGPAPADEVPLLLDLLATATAAGMSGTVAFGAAATALRGPLGRSLRAVATTTSLGGQLTDGLHAASSELDLPDLARAATLLERSGSLGVPVSVALRDLAAEHRRTRRRAAEQRARTAPVRMLFPLVFLVLPAFLLLTVVPMLLATLGSLS